MRIQPETLVEILVDSGVLRLSEDTVTIGMRWNDLPEATVPSSKDIHLKRIWGNKVVIGLTGNIAVGKSTVLTYLTRLGAGVVDADRMVHKLREPGAAGYDAIVVWLGEDILLPDGRIDVTQLSANAFSDPAFLRRLEGVFGPLVVSAIGEWARNSDKEVIVVEAIRLLDGDLKHSVDQVWVVDASRETQIARLVGDRGLTTEQAVARIDAQGAQQSKLAQADVIVKNDGDLSETHRQILLAWCQILDVLAAANLLAIQMVSQYCAACIEHSGGYIDEDLMFDVLSSIARQFAVAERVPKQQVLSIIADVLG